MAINVVVQSDNNVSVNVNTSDIAGSLAVANAIRAEVARDEAEIALLDLLLALNKYVSQTITTAGVVNNLALNADTKHLILTAATELTGVILEDRRVLLIEARGLDVLIKHESVSSDSANRFNLPNNTDFLIENGKRYMFIKTDVKIGLIGDVSSDGGDMLASIYDPAGGARQVAFLNQLHNVLTLGTANGLSLANQVLSLALASSISTGALSSTDWNTFNSKIGGTIAAGQVAFGTGVNQIGGDSGLVWDNVFKRIGIGTTTPGAKFELRDTSDVTFRVVKTGVSVLDLTVANGFSSISSSNSNDLAFIAGGNEIARFKVAGNLGVGTDSPTDKLDVNGTTRIRTLNNGVGNFVTTSATGVLQQRTQLESANDMLKSITGYNATVSQRLEHDASGNIAWVNI